MVVSYIPVSSNRARVVEDGWTLGSLEVDSNRRFIVKIERLNAYSEPVWFTDRAEAEAEVIAEGRAVRDRWQRALQRAVVAGLDPLELAGLEDTWAVESGSRPGVAYLVTGRRAQRCTCPAGAAGDAVCQHRAAVLAALGVLSAPDPEPAVAVCEVTGEPIAADGFYVSTCRTCAGLGYTYSAWGHEVLTPTCRSCGGSGRAAAA